MWPLKVKVIASFSGAVSWWKSLEEVDIYRISTDSRNIGENSLFVPLKGDSFDGHHFIEKALENGALVSFCDQDYLPFISKNYHSKLIIVKNSLASLRSFAKIFRKRLPCHICGIGGSNGKTTTKEFLRAFLSGSSWNVLATEKSENGFIGVAKTLCLSDFEKSKNIHHLVLEIGIDEIGAMEKHMEIAECDMVMLTALGPEHLDGLGTWEKGIEEEFLMFSQKYGKSVRVWQCADDEIIKKIDYFLPQDIFIVPFERYSFFQEKVLFKEKKVSYLLYRTEKQGLYENLIWFWNSSHIEDMGRFLCPLPGVYNAQNMALALGASLALGRTKEEVEKGFLNFQQPQMRSAIKKYKNWVIIEDCYNASPLSMKSALELLLSAEFKDEVKYVILGDMLELGQMSKECHLHLGNFLQKISKFHLYLYGTRMYDLYRRICSEEDLYPGCLTKQYLPQEADPSLWGESLPQTGGVILVKGSRSMKLERVLQRLNESL